MKKIYWRLAERGTGFWIVEFWTKGDKSNVVSQRMVDVSHAKLEGMVEQITGMKRFELIQVKDR